MSERNLDKAALRGEPSYVWRAGQQRRLEMIIRTAGERIQGKILENGCGVGMYVEHLALFGGTVIGLEYDFERTAEARINSPHILNAKGATYAQSADWGVADPVLSGRDRDNPRRADLDGPRRPRWTG